MADNLTLSASFSKTDIDFAKQINHKLASVNSRFDTNQIWTNVGYPKFTHFSSKWNTDMSLIKIGNVNISEVDYNKFSWHASRQACHNQYSCRLYFVKSSKANGILYQLRFSTPQELIDY